MSLLMRNANVTTRYGGGFVQSVDGLSGGDEGGQPVDWFYYVNGVQAPQGAAATNVHPGDHIWWDLHDWSQTDSVPAVVGSFPEPFLNGIGGKRLPVRIECATVSSAPCRRSARACARSACPPRSPRSDRGDEPETLRVLVGPWSAAAGRSGARIRSNRARARAASTRASPRPARRSRCSTEQGGVARTLTAGAGLVAATRYGEEAPVWFITGTDAAGVRTGGARARRRHAGAIASRWRSRPAASHLPAPARDPGRRLMSRDRAARGRSSTVVSPAPCTPRARAWARCGRSR